MSGRAVLALVALGVGGCTGTIDNPDGSGGAPIAGGPSVGGQGGSGAGSHTAGVSNGSMSSGGSANPGGAGGSGGSSGGDVDPGTQADGVPVASRVLRLSYPDYDRTLTDLLRQTVSVSPNFPAEQPNLGPYED